MVLPAIAANVPAYAATIPYITPEEYAASPTGVDVSQLVPRGAAGTNASVLQVMIARASSWADSLVNQTLCATTEVQTGTYRVGRDGAIRVVLDNAPIVMVTAVAQGATQAAAAALTDLSGVQIGRRVVTIPLPGSGSPYQSSGGQVFASVTYVAGWANATIVGGPYPAGSTSLTIANPTGILPGLQMAIYDAGTTETVIVGPGYVMGSTTVPLATPTVASHDAGTALSAFPPAIKQAVISLTSALIKQRGAGSLSLASAAGNAGNAAGDGSMQDMESAVDLLSQYRRVV